ncbi:MAG TPA: hypothetical protein PKY70_13885, partial [Nakamurella multipartita]|nr:hypothetical protein [Nakamurella multipartita]
TTLFISQSGLTLPDRDDYFDDGERARRLREAYRVYARRLLGLAGAAPDAAALEALLDFETRLAGATVPRAQLRDPNAVYHPHTAASLVEDWPHPYSRAEAVFPAGVSAAHKYFPPVGRIDGAFGDRNLVCSCPAPEAYA